MLLPIWGLAGIEISRYFRIPESSLAAFGQAGIVFVLSVLFWLIGRGPFSGEFTGLILVAIPMLAVLTTILIGMGWSWDAARSGVIWGLGLILGTYMMAAMSWASQRGHNDPAALWMPNPGTGQAALLEGTLQELGIMQNGRPDSIQVLSLVDTPSLRWMLRNIKEVTFVSTLKPEYLPPVILTPEDGSDLSQTMSYRGQDFLWSSYPGWFGPLPSHWWPWVTSRQATINHESLVLWARSDLFPEESAATSDDEAVEPLEGLISPLEDDSPE
jgi:hypothetical protein